MATLITLATYLFDQRCIDSLQQNCIKCLIDAKYVSNHADRIRRLIVLLMDSLLFLSRKSMKILISMNKFSKQRNRS
jgi:hypothetical protein